ncbi:Hypothetical protein, putative, partial [Bodo saltans]
GIERVLIAADELSKLTDRIEGFKDAKDKAAAMSTMTAMYDNRWSLLGSGFTHGNFVTIQTLSGRSTSKTTLKPLTITTRSEFKLMRKFVEKKLKKVFTPALRSLFERVKNVPGYMGVWVQMLDKGEKPVRSLTDLDLPFVKTLVIPELQAEPALFSDYWRAMANGNKGSNVDKASDVITKLEKLGVIVTLPSTNNAGYGVSHRFLSPVVLAHESLTDRIEGFKDAKDKAAAMSTMTAMYGNRWSLVGSGFTHKNFVTIQTLSGRSTRKTTLKPLTITTRSEFKLMREFVEKKLKKVLTPALRSLFERVKNVPGYMGVWVQMLDKGEKPVRSLTDLELPFVNTLVVPELQAEPALFSDYWRAMANGNKGSNVDKASAVMTKLEKLGVIVTLPSTNNAGYGVSHRFLSPVVLAHESLETACEHTVIKRAIDKLEVVKWTKKNKGESLEYIVEASLALHATYVNDPISKAQGMTQVTLEALIKRLCGKSHIRVLATKDRDGEKSEDCESADVTFPTNGLDNNVKDVQAFPSVYRRHSKATSTKQNLRKKAPHATTHDERFQEAIEALKSRDVAVLRPALSNNMGCD